MKTAFTLFTTILVFGAIAVIVAMAVVDILIDLGDFNDEDIDE